MSESTADEQKEREAVQKRQEAWAQRSILFENKIKEFARFITDFQQHRSWHGGHLYKYLSGKSLVPAYHLPVIDDCFHLSIFDLDGLIKYDLGNVRKELQYMRDEIDGILNQTTYSSSSSLSPKITDSEAHLEWIISRAI